MNTISEAQEERNNKIIRAVLEKARTECPGSLALVGINGSFATGRNHARSDLDLLLVINDEAGYRLSSAFTEDDMQAGHDIYCFTWDRLRQTARCESPHIAKLLDAKIVYSAGKETDEKLEAIRAEARAVLRAPFGKEDLARAEKFLTEAEHAFAMTMTAGTLPETRLWSAALIDSLEDALTMLNKEYYRFGTAFRYEELSALKNKPDGLCARIERIAAAGNAADIKDAAADLMKAVQDVFRKTRGALSPALKTPGPGDLAGTYEEMYSNWRGKMHLAAETGNRHLALESLFSFRWMLLEEIGAEYAIGEYDVMAAYDPDDLRKTEAGFDALLFRYKAECEKAGVKIRQYPNADAFVEEYLRKPAAED